MKQVVVIGLGSFATAAATMLAELGNEVMAVDTDEAAIQRIASQVTHAVVADARDAAALRQLGVAECDCAILGVSSDIASSILITMALKELGVPEVICKASSEIHRRALEKVGADKVVFPERETGIKLAQNVSSARMLDFIELSHDYGIAEIACPGPWPGKTIRELNVRAVYGVNILAVKEHGQKIVVSPGGEFLLAEDDVVMVLGSYSQLNAVQAL